MIEVKTADLIGPALDWAVAKTVGHEPIVTPFKNSRGNTLYLAEWAQREGIRWQPSTDWSQGGPLIEKHRVSVGDSIHPDDNWTATLYVPDEEPWQFDGPTPLIAAMRCLVASKLGEVVTVPKELLS